MANSVIMHLEETCVHGCTKCAETCPFGAIHVHSKKAKINHYICNGECLKIYHCSSQVPCMTACSQVQKDDGSYAFAILKA